MIIIEVCCVDSLALVGDMQIPGGISSIIVLETLSGRSVTILENFSGSSFGILKTSLSPKDLVLKNHA